MHVSREFWPIQPSQMRFQSSQIHFLIGIGTSINKMRLTVSLLCAKIATIYFFFAESEFTSFSVFFPRKNCEIKLHVFTSFCFFISEKNNVNLKCND